MKRKSVYIFICIALIFSLVSCNLPVGNEGNTSDLELTITAQALIIEQAAQSPTPSLTPIVIVITATPADTATPDTVGAPVLAVTETVIPATIVLVSPAVGAVTVTVSTATNCRTGPGQNFSIVYGMPVNQVAEVVAKNTYSGYWIIKIPGSANTCWLWGQYATVTGNTASLSEVVTPTSAATKKPTATVTITPSNTVAAPAVPAPPAAPSGLQASIACKAFPNATQVTGSIFWADNSNNEKAFFLNVEGVSSKILGPNTTSDYFIVSMGNTTLQTVAPGGQFTITLYACSGDTEATCSAVVTIKQSGSSCP